MRQERAMQWKTKSSFLTFRLYEICRNNENDADTDADDKFHHDKTLGKLLQYHRAKNNLAQCRKIFS